MLLGRIKYYGMAILTALLAIGAAVVRMRSLKNQRDKARQQRDVARARVHVAKVEKSIEKKQREELSRRESDIKERIEKNELEKLDNLTDSNDF